MNAIRVLVTQHRAIEALFDEVEHERRRRVRASAASRLAEELIAHMAAEEAVFYPALRRVMASSPDATERPCDGHLPLRTQLRRVLETSVSESSFGDRIEVLRALFAQHATDQEATLFSRVRDAISEAQLEVLGDEILAARPPVWIVTTEGRTPIPPGHEWALRSRVSLPIPPSSD
jgi:hemerythrin superfamily protein